jgi:hypothetical protein
VSVHGRKPLLILALAVVAAVAVAEPPEPGARYAGVEVCIGCHQSPELGNQALVWTGSGHARSWLALQTGMTEMIDPQAKGMVAVGHGQAIATEARRLGAETDCLKCHATAAADPSRWEPTFHLEDGVQCEACHGPGSLHAARMRAASDAAGAPSQPRSAVCALERPDLGICMDCHRAKPSHAVLERPPFDPAAAWTRIVHPLPER